jgi:hypothetical protein
MQVFAFLPSKLHFCRDIHAAATVLHYLLLVMLMSMPLDLLVLDGLPYNYMMLVSMPLDLVVLDGLSSNYRWLTTAGVQKPPL